MKTLFFLVLTFALISCNSSGGGSKSAKVPEVNPVPEPEIIVNSSIFSVWTANNGVGANLDFTSFQFDVEDNFHLAGCNIATTFEDQTDTEEWDFIVMKFNNSTWDGVTGASDPGCSGFNGTWMMAVEGNELEMCAPPTWDTCYYYTTN